MKKGSHHTPESREKMRESAILRLRGCSGKELEQYRKRRHVAALMANIKKKKV
jgi:hypothetical protein